MRPANNIVERFYRSLYRIRRVEEEIVRIHPSDKITCPVHLSIGQEAVPVGVCEALGHDDVVFGTYRSHALYLAKGGDLKGMMADLYGRSAGCTKGKGGSMHLADVKHGVMGASAIVATNIPVSLGYAFAMRYLHKTSLVVSFFGDGATEEGAFYETMNFAALKRLPIIFVCENNLYAIHSHTRARQAGGICDRVRAFGIRAERLEDDDVFRLYDRVGDVAAEMREEQNGPYFFECMTYRWMEHVGIREDFELGYRTREEARTWIERDQVKRLAGMLDDKVRKSVQDDVEREIKEAIEFAENSPFPAPAELYEDLFAEG